MNELQLLAIDVLMLDARRTAVGPSQPNTDRLWQRATRLAEVALAENHDDPRAVYDDASGTHYHPFIASDGRVGYRCERDGGGAFTYLYFNPSVNTPEEPDKANVFVYQGEANDPCYDSATHHYLIWED